MHVHTHIINRTFTHTQAYAHVHTHVAIHSHGDKSRNKAKALFAKKLSVFIRHSYKIASTMSHMCVLALTDVFCESTRASYRGTYRLGGIEIRPLALLEC